MVGQIGPLVQVGRRRTALALHLLGGAAGGALIGVALGFAGLLLRAAAALAYAASVDLGLLRIRQLTWQRQTPGDWPCSLGHYPGIFAWGFDLGLGLTTRIPYQSLLVLPLAAVLVGSFPAAVAITTVYGASRALAVVAAVSAGGDDFPATCDVIQKRLFSFKALVGAAALVLAVAIVVF